MMTARTFGRYEVVAPLERGGTAEVFRAWDTVLDRTVAVKVLHGELSNDTGFVDRFYREAKLVAALRHQHILQIYDFGVSDDDLYMVMEFLDGGTLKERLARLRERQELMSLGEIADLLDQLAAALDYAHSRGAVHRDIKPANIMFRGPSEAVITDFGVAKLLGDIGSSTVAGSLIGSPAYMSPEQAAGRSVDARSDLYSLGVVLYQMAAGRVPFESNNPTTVMVGHINQPTPPPRALNPALPEPVQHVILRSMAKDRKLRFCSAMEMADAFRAAIRGLAPMPLTTALPRNPAAGATADPATAQPTPSPSHPASEPRVRAEKPAPQPAVAATPSHAAATTHSAQTVPDMPLNAASPLQKTTIMERPPSAPRRPTGQHAEPKPLAATVVASAPKALAATVIASAPNTADPEATLVEHAPLALAMAGAHASPEDTRSAPTVLIRRPTGTQATRAPEPRPTKTRPIPEAAPPRTPTQEPRAPASMWLVIVALLLIVVLGGAIATLAL